MQLYNFRRNKQKGKQLRHWGGSCQRHIIKARNTRGANTNHSQTRCSEHIYAYTYIYTPHCVCVCVCVRHALESDDVLGFGLPQSSAWGSQAIDKATQDCSWPAAVAKLQIELVTSRRKRDGCTRCPTLRMRNITYTIRVGANSKQKDCPAS